MNLSILEQLVRETRHSNLFSRKSSMPGYSSLLTLAERKAINSLSATTRAGMGTAAMYLTVGDRVDRIWF